MGTIKSKELNDHYGIGYDETSDKGMIKIVVTTYLGSEMIAGQYIRIPLYLFKEELDVLISELQNYRQELFGREETPKG